MAIVVNKNNLNKFMNSQKIAFSGIKPGMILSFNYSSPDGIHDPNPMIYVLSVEFDRVWGLNLHYKFALMGEILTNKEHETMPHEPKNTSNPGDRTAPVAPSSSILSKLPSLNKALPSKALPSLGQQIYKDLQKISKPSKANNLKKPAMRAKPQIQPPQKSIGGTQGMDIFSLNTKPDIILRNYLPKRIKNLSKMIYKA